MPLVENSTTGAGCAIAEIVQWVAAIIGLNNPDKLRAYTRQRAAPVSVPERIWMPVRISVRKDRRTKARSCCGCGGKNARCANRRIHNRAEEDKDLRFTCNRTD